MTTLGIVIVNWNGGQYIVNCINSILRSNQKCFILEKIVVVDNGSTDNSLESLYLFKGLTVVENKANYGFGRACNIGAKLINSPLILFLNPDIVLLPDTLDKSVAFYIENKDRLNFGILSVQLHDENMQIDKSCSRFPSVYRILADSSGISKIFKRAGMKMRDFDHKKNMIVEQVIGAYFLLERKLFIELYGFDERFFVYFEEVDFSYRAKQIGINSFYYVGTSAMHIGGGCSRNVKARRLCYLLTSKIAYAKKHFSRVGYIIILGITLLIEMIARIIFLTVKLDFIGVYEVVRAYCLLLMRVLNK